MPAAGMLAPVPLDETGLLCLSPTMSVTSIQRHLSEAQRALRAGLRDQARPHFEAMLQIDEEEPTARNWLGADALARTDASAAAMHFGIACKRKPQERAHWINLAAAHRIQGEAERERAALEEALAIDQTDLLALIRVAELHERLGQETPAAERWSAVLALSSSIKDRSPEFAEILAHANHYVGIQQDKLVDSVERALADELAVAGARDLRRMRRAADAWLGRRPIYTNQCEGLHYPFLPADEFFEAEHFPWLGELEAATSSIVAELETILADRVPS